MSGEWSWDYEDGAMPPYYQVYDDDGTLATVDSRQTANLDVAIHALVDAHNAGLLQAKEETDALLAVKKAAEVVMQLWREDPQATLLGIPAIGEALAATRDHVKKAP